MNSRIGKKAAGIDNFFAIVAFFSVVLVALAVLIAWQAIDTEISIWTDSSIGVGIRNEMDNTANQFDFILVMAYFGIHLGILVLAYMLRTHPVIFVAGIILVAILALVSAPISNAYEEVIAESDISAASNSIPVANFIMRNLPIFEVVWGLITLVAMFGFARMEG